MDCHVYILIVTGANRDSITSFIVDSHVKNLEKHGGARIFQKNVLGFEKFRIVKQKIL